MIAHTGVNVSDFKKSKELYTAMLTPLDYRISFDMADACGFMKDRNTEFWVGESTEKPQGMHVAFLANGTEEVQAFYDAALAAGAADNGAPGYRPDYSPGYYAAFIHDFDGNNIEAVWFDPKKENA